MRNLKMIFTGGFVALILLSNGTAVGQNQTEEPLTVTEVSNIERPVGVGRRLTVSMTNNTTKGIHAMVLVVIPNHPDPAASKTLQRTHILGRLIPTSEGPPYAGQSTWEHTFPVGTANFRGIPHDGTFKVLVDFVVFDDGTYWGEARTYQHLKLDGMHRGALMEQRRLRKLLQEEGLEAVQADLMGLLPGNLRLGQTAKDVRASSRGNAQPE